MNLTAYRHLSIPWLVMRDGLRFMPEGSVEFEVVGRAKDGEAAVVIWAVRNGLLDEWRRGLLRRLAAGAHCGEAAPQLGDDNDHPAYTSLSPVSATGWTRGMGRNKRTFSARGARRKIRASTVPHFLSGY